MESISASAWPSATPGFRRAITCRKCEDRCSQAPGGSARGTQSWARGAVKILSVVPVFPGNSKPGGITPTTVQALASIVTVLPTIERSALKCCSTGHTDSNPVSSPDAKVRPFIGSTPSSPKSPGDTAAPSTRSGLAVPARLNVRAASNSANCSKTELRSRQSRKLAAAGGFCS